MAPRCIAGGLLERISICRYSGVGTSNHLIRLIVVHELHSCVPTFVQADGTEVFFHGTPLHLVGAMLRGFFRRCSSVAAAMGAGVRIGTGAAELLDSVEVSTTGCNVECSRQLA